MSRASAPSRTYLRIGTLSRFGDVRKRKVCRLYNIWDAMRKRCLHPSSPNFQYYGAKGISICVEWRDDYDAFRAWAVSHGYKKDLTLDRYPDMTGNYGPSNCRWATREEQTYNSSQTKVITFNGETLLSPIWAKRLGIHPTVLRARINQGWALEHALTIPKGSYRPLEFQQKRGRKPMSDSGANK